MKCANCGAEVPGNSIFCIACGSRVETPAAICGKCRQPLAPGAQFCINCGTPVLSVPAVPAAQVQAGPACTQCGAQIQPGTVFCPKCGARQAAAPAYAPPPAAAYPSPQPIAQQPYAQQPYGQPPYGQPPYANPYAAPYGQQMPAGQPPRKKKGLLVALIIILAVLLAGGGIYALFGRTIKRAIMGPKATYLSIEGKALKDQAADLVDDLVAYGNREERPEIGGSIIDVNLDLDAEALGMDATTANAIKNITIKSTMMYDRSGEKPLFYDKLDLLASDEPLMTMEGYYDKDQLVIGFPDILDKALVATSEDISGLLGTAGVDSTQAGNGLSVVSSLTGFDLGIDETEMKSAMNKIVDIMLDNIDETEFEAGQTLEAGDVSAEYDLYTITIEKESARQMILDILELVRDDEQFYSLASQIDTYIATANGTGSSELTLEKYQSEIDQAISDVETPDSTETDFTLVQQVYVDKNDEVFGRDIMITDTDGKTLLHFMLANPVDGSSEGVHMVIEAEDSTYDYLSTFEVKDEKKTGTATLTADGSEVMSVSFEDLILVYKEDGSMDKILGTLDFSLTIPETDVETTIPAPTGFSFSGVMDGDRYVMSIGVDSMFSIAVGIEEISAGDVQLPSYDPDNLVSISDTTALSELITPDVQTKLMDIVAQLGLMPAE